MQEWVVGLITEMGELQLICSKVPYAALVIKLLKCRNVARHVVCCNASDRKMNPATGAKQ